MKAVLSTILLASAALAAPFLSKRQDVSIGTTECCLVGINNCTPTPEAPACTSIFGTPDKRALEALAKRQDITIGTTKCCLVGINNCEPTPEIPSCQSIFGTPQ